MSVLVRSVPIMMLALALAVSAVSALADGGGSSTTTTTPPPQAGGRRRPLRPALTISERIVPIQLVETYAADDYFRKPRRKQSRPQVLFAALDKDFDSQWMSVERPAVVTEEPVLLESSRNHRKLMSSARDRVNQEFSMNSTESTRGLLEDWLVRQASCPVRYVWDDVGPLFWPRWIKRGECVNSAERSCSWPAGMQCIPAESVTIHLLRWHCRHRSRKTSSLPPSSPSSSLPMSTKTKSKSKATSEVSGVAVDSLRIKMKQMRQFATVVSRRRQTNADGVRNRKHLRCQWLKVPYPVTAECVCSC